MPPDEGHHQLLGISHLRGRRAHVRFEQGPEAGEHPCVHAVSLRQLTERLTEALGLTRVDLAKWQACLAHRALESAVIRARLLENEAGDWLASEHFSGSP